MALPKWMEDFLSSEAVKNLVKLAVLTAVMAILNHFQMQTQTQQINERTKKSENLIQQTVTENAVAVVSAMTETPVAEVAPIVEEAAEQVQP